LSWISFVKLIPIISKYENTWTKKSYLKFNFYFTYMCVVGEIQDKKIVHTEEASIGGIYWVLKFGIKWIEGKEHSKNFTSRK